METAVRGASASGLLSNFLGRYQSGNQVEATRPTFFPLQGPAENLNLTRCQAEKHDTTHHARHSRKHIIFSISRIWQK